MPQNRFEQALATLQSLILTTARPYQSRAATALHAIRALLRGLDNPHRGYPIIHITGSKGKGSTALLLEQLLSAAGYRVGVFSSPHLQHWTERFRIAGQAISETRFAELMEAIAPGIEALRSANPYDPPTFFDALTAMALLLFQQEQVDYAIVEVGLGGRLDASNIVEPVVCCITSIELEHTDKLGPTLLDIAREKAGIIKPGASVVCGPLPPAAQALIDARAATFQVPVQRYGRDFNIQAGPDGLLYQGLGIQQTIRFPLSAAQHQLNAALAISCALSLPPRPPPQLLGVLSHALATAHLPGRCELLSRQPWIVIDGAHTTDSAAALRRFVDSLPCRRVHWLLSFTSGKQPQSIVDALYRPGDRITLTQADPTRSQSAAPVTTLLSQHLGLAVEAIADPRQAVLRCRASLADDELLCVSGSVYLAGLARSLL